VKHSTKQDAARGRRAAARAERGRIRSAALSFTTASVVAMAWLLPFVVAPAHARVIEVDAGTRSAAITIPIAPLYLMTGDYTVIVIFFALQGAFGAGGMHVQYPAYLAERFPTEVRATASGFVYHQGAIFGGLVGPVLAYFATTMQMGFAIPMLIGTSVACVSLVVAILFSPETKGKVLQAELSLA